ncbi:A24 family peptidase [Phenylobacterium sp.]|uniref:A24 family peptidase n=1 Tax=Phenylobacterium sp. TaxID=1871053 RepID=UPI002B720D92|nr:A24 family peptidase [Phenylobacterium sp.]HVI34455.1 A24 family peptidase [Phenylobacterium sp.]
MNWPDLPLLGWAAILTGAAVGPVLATLSLRLPGVAARPGRVRVLALALACQALAAWSLAIHPDATGVLGALMAWQLLLLAMLDAEHLWLPRVLTLPLIATGLAAALGDGPDALAARAVGAAAGFASLAVVARGYRRLRGREGLGGGDAYLLAGGGAWVGWTALPTVLIWAAAAGLAAVALLALAGRRTAAGQPIPFGVFLALGIWIAFLYGPLGRA